MQLKAQLHFSMAKNFPNIIVCPHELKYFNRETQKLIIS